jgi:hypothetical protein
MVLDNRGCRWSGYGEDYFLAYCNSRTYGDYEHGALYYGAEPAAAESLRNAQVIFLGNSRTQAAFSTRAVRSYFASRNVRFFVMGFGYGEWSAFSLATLLKSRAAPKVLVINADPFFSDKLSQPAQEALEGRPGFLWRLALKALFQRIHRNLCPRAQGVCPASEASIFRSATDGQWYWVGPMVRDLSVPLDRAAQKPIAPDELLQATDLGKKFLDAVGLDRRCVVLTGIPNSELDAPDVAATLAAALNTSSIFPPADDLSTIEGLHLSLASAERWSDAFVAAMTPVLRDCISPAIVDEEPPGAVIPDAVQRERSISAFTDVCTMLPVLSGRGYLSAGS